MPFGCEWLNFINWQRQRLSYLPQNRWRFSLLRFFDLFKWRASARRGSENKSGKYWNSIQIIISFWNSSHWIEEKKRNDFNVYDTCLSLWKLDFHFLFRSSSVKHDFMIIEKNIGNPFHLRGQWWWSDENFMSLFWMFCFLIFCFVNWDENFMGGSWHNRVFGGVFNLYLLPCLFICSNYYPFHFPFITLFFNGLFLACPIPYPIYLLYFPFIFPSTFPFPYNFP